MPTHWQYIFAIGKPPFVTVERIHRTLFIAAGQADPKDSLAAARKWMPRTDLYLR
jgi:hypothetical protein